MIDVFDIIAFVVFAVLLPIIVVIVVTLGSLPGRIAQERDHPQAAVISIASWVGLAMLGLGAVAGGAEAGSLTMMGVLWPLALVWAYFTPTTTGPLERPSGKEVAA
jgi:Protein of unknown function (DUF3302)